MGLVRWAGGCRGGGRDLLGYDTMGAMYILGCSGVLLCPWSMGSMGMASTDHNCLDYHVGVVPQVLHMVFRHACTGGMGRMHRRFSLGRCMPPTKKAQGLQRPPCIMQVPAQQRQTRPTANSHALNHTNPSFSGDLAPTWVTSVYGAFLWLLVVCAGTGGTVCAVAKGSIQKGMMCLGDAWL